MDIRETRDLLMQIRKLSIDIKINQHEIEELNSRLLPGAIRYDKEKVQTSGDGDIYTETVQQVMQLEERNKRMLGLYTTLVDRVKAAIKKIMDPEERLVLMATYLDHAKPQEIADEVPCSLRTYYYLRRRAIRSLAEQL